MTEGDEGSRTGIESSYAVAVGLTPAPNENETGRP